MKIALVHNEYGKFSGEEAIVRAQAELLKTGILLPFLTEAVLAYLIVFLVSYRRFFLEFIILTQFQNSENF